MSVTTDRMTAARTELIQGGVYLDAYDQVLIELVKTPGLASPMMLAMASIAHSLASIGESLAAT